MKVRYKRRIMMIKEDVIEMTPREYCEQRANMSILKEKDEKEYDGDVELIKFAPYSERDKEELEAFWALSREQRIWEQNTMTEM